MCTQNVGHILDMHCLQFFTPLGLCSFTGVNIRKGIAVLVLKCTSFRHMTEGRSSSTHSYNWPQVTKPLRMGHPDLYSKLKFPHTSIVSTRCLCTGKVHVDTWITASDNLIFYLCAVQTNKININPTFTLLLCKVPNVLNMWATRK